MTSTALPGSQAPWRDWWAVMEKVTRLQMMLLTAPWRQTLFLSEAMFARPAGRGATPPAGATPAASAEQLQRQAVERTARGLAPPRQVYDVAFRDRLDWSQLPAWAWPADPELFEGAAHEG